MDIVRMSWKKVLDQISSFIEVQNVGTTEPTI